MNGSEILCPRCERNYVQPGEEGPGQTLSRVTRDDGAPVYICGDCGIREAMRERVGLAPIPPDDWPRSADELAMEDELRD
jgi:transcription elongation factor Elf1